MANEILVPGMLLRKEKKMWQNPSSEHLLGKSWRLYCTDYALRPTDNNNSQGCCEDFYRKRTVDCGDCSKSSNSAHNLQSELRRRRNIGYLRHFFMKTETKQKGNVDNSS